MLKLFSFDLKLSDLLRWLLKLFIFGLYLCLELLFYDLEGFQLVISFGNCERRFSGSIFWIGLFLPDLQLKFFFSLEPFHKCRDCILIDREVSCISPSNRLILAHLYIMGNRKSTVWHNTASTFKFILKLLNLSQQRDILILPDSLFLCSSIQFYCKLFYPVLKLSFDEVLFTEFCSVYIALAFWLSQLVLGLLLILFQLQKLKLKLLYNCCGYV